MHLGNLLTRAANLHGDLPALIRGDVVVADHTTLARRAAGLAHGLRHHLGLPPGSRVAVAMSNDPAYVEILFACWRAGLAAVPVNAKLHAREIAYILNHSGAAVVFTDGKLAATVGMAAGAITPAPHILSIDDADYARLVARDPLAQAPVSPHDLAWLFYTSGTTGRPKGAMLTHANLLAMTACHLIDVDPVLPGDRVLHAAPMSHGSGLYIIPHLARAAGQIIPESRGFEPDELVGLFARHRRVSMFAAPTMVHRFIHHPAVADSDDPLPGLKTIIYGGAPMYLADKAAALARLGPRLAQIYGQGESPMTITALGRDAHLQPDDEPGRARLASAGPAQWLVDVSVVDDTGRPLPAGETGEVTAAGPSVMAGYWRDPDATARTLRDGRLFTGDMGALDAQGYLTLKDRSKDVIISGGSNIYPREVEEVLLDHPAVAEVSVIGAADADWGEVVVAFVVADGDGVDAAALDRLCLDRIARFKRPKRYVFVDALPKNNYGKVPKTALRARLAEGVDERPGQPPA